MSVQTSYSVAPVIGIAGQLADLANKYARSAVNEKATALPFGILVKVGSDPDGVLEVTSPADEIAGVLLHTHALDNQMLGTDLGLPADDMGPVLRRGVVYVTVEEAVTRESPVYVRIATGIEDTARTQKGAFRCTDDTNTAFLLKGARFLDDAAEDGIVPLEFDAALCGAHDLVTLRATHAANANGGVQTTFIAKTPDDRFFVIDSVGYYNETGLVADNTNAAKVQVLQGSVVAAGWNTDGNDTVNGIGATATPEGTITADTPLALTLNTLANRTVPPGTRINTVVTEIGTTTVPAGTVVIHGRYI